MIGRLFICAVALVAAIPFAACAGERDIPTPDAMALLLLDAGTTWSAEASRPILTVRYAIDGAAGTNTRRRAEPVDLAAFEELDASLIAMTELAAARGNRHGAARDVGPGFTLYDDWERVARPAGMRFVDTDGGRAEVRGAVDGFFNRRRGRAIDATVVLRVDGRPESPLLSMGGGVGDLIRRAIPRN